MTNYLIDSDIVIDFLNKKGFAVSFFLKTSNKNIFISIISWLEIMYGFKKSSSNRKLSMFNNLLVDLKIQVLPIDIKVAQEYLNCKINLEEKRASLGDFDLLIAATAIVHECMLVTRNLKHFSRIPKLKVMK